MLKTSAGVFIYPCFNFQSLCLSLGSTCWRWRVRQLQWQQPHLEANDRCWSHRSPAWHKKTRTFLRSSRDPPLSLGKPVSVCRRASIRHLHYFVFVFTRYSLSFIIVPVFARVDFSQRFTSLVALLTPPPPSSPHRQPHVPDRRSNSLSTPSSKWFHPPSPLSSPH